MDTPTPPARTMHNSSCSPEVTLVQNPPHNSTPYVTMPPCSELAQCLTHNLSGS
ncbi:hypothetical protein BDR04DRAFT_1097184 [Suillus decipiens]|nr:hypothetical protein BDR04DRAFT_1097184 [Suillus decipiens]